MVCFVALLAVLYVGFIVGVVAYKEFNHVRWAIRMYRVKKAVEFYTTGHVIEAENTLDFLGPSMQSWYDAMLAKALQAPVSSNIRFVSQPVFDVQLDLLIRTAIALSPTSLLVSCHRPHLVRRERPLGMEVLRDAWSDWCSIGSVQCTCTEIGNGDKIFCQTLTPFDSSARFLRFGTWWDTISIPIEHPEPSSSSGVHICVQGLIWTDAVYGPIPDELAHTWVAHYSRLGVTDIHVYTNATELADVFLRTPERHPSTRLWLHDSLYPRKNYNTSFLWTQGYDPINRGLGYNRMDYFIESDCMARAKAMGASHAVFVDLDEFVFPSHAPLKSLQNAFALQKQSGALILPSFIFHTTICLPHALRNTPPDSFHDFLFTFRLAQRDASRTKVALNVGGMSPQEVAKVDLLIHTVFAGASLEEGMHAHVHHYREGWHPLVCSKHLGNHEEPPLGWEIHDDGLDLDPL